MEKFCQRRRIAMKITPRQTDILLRGNYSFSLLGFSMLLTRLKGLYANDPSQETLHSAMSEINTFLDKFKGLMKNDYTTISQL
jgi:uncharacterized protein YutD